MLHRDSVFFTLGSSFSCCMLHTEYWSEIDRTSKFIFQPVTFCIVVFDCLRFSSFPPPLGILCVFDFRGQGSSFRGAPVVSFLEFRCEYVGGSRV